MALGPYLLLRRIDTDFVNLTPIVEWCGKGRGYPVLSMIPNAVVVGRGWGSEKVCGVWVPLEVAQSYVKDLDTRSTGAGKDEMMEGLNVFLSDELVERFPSALKDFHRTNSSGRMLKQFGRWFESMVTFAHAQAAAVTAPSNSTTNAVPVVTSGSLNPQKVIQADTRQSWLQKETIMPVPMTGAFALGAVLTIGEKEREWLNNQHRQELSSQQHYGHRRIGSGKQEGDCLDVASPLSAREQEIFQELCVIPGEEEEKAKEHGARDCKMEEGVKEEEDTSTVIVSGKSGLTSVNVHVDMAGEDTETKHLPLPEEAQLVPKSVIEESQPPSRTSEDTDVSPPKTRVVTKTRITRAATMSRAAEKREQEKQEKQQTLRRSKRVADALAAQTQLQQQQQRTRSRKRPGSRNTLS